LMRMGVSLAARLMMAAPWGSVWLDKTVAQRAERLFVVKHEGDIVRCASRGGLSTLTTNDGLVKRGCQHMMSWNVSIRKNF